MDGPAFEPHVDVPPSWQRIDPSGPAGIWMVIGAPDTGKSTFARYLFQRFLSQGRAVAYLDGDPGQSILGPPTTLTLSIPVEGSSDFPPLGRTWRWFIGSTSPAGHMLAVLTGLERLVRAAQAAGVRVIVHDTSGLIEPSAGGSALKFAKIELLQPEVVFAIQKKDELEPILQPLRRSLQRRLVILSPSAAVRQRDLSGRQAYRAAQYAAYFHKAHSLALEWSRYAVFPYPQFALNRLIALRDETGFTLGLGIVQSINRPNRRLEILTPLDSLEGLVSVYIGDVYLDPVTFRDRRI